MNHFFILNFKNVRNFLWTDSNQNMMESSRDNIIAQAEALKEQYSAFFEQPVWAFCHDTERIIRPYSTSDFKREYFIPDL